MLSRLLITARLRLRFCTIHKEVEELTMAATRRENYQQAVKLSQKYFRTLQNLPVPAQIRAMYIFSRYDLRDNEQFQQSEMQIARKVTELKPRELVELLEVLYAYHRRYDPQRTLFSLINNRLLRLKDIPVDELLPLVNALAKLQWNDRAINDVLGLVCNKPQLVEAVTLQQTVRLCMLLAERRNGDLSHLLKLLESAYGKLQRAEISKLSLADIVIIHELFFSNFVRVRVALIEEYLRAKASLSEVLGSFTAQTNLLAQQRAQIEELSQRIKQEFQSSFEGKIAQLHLSYSDDLLALFGPAVHPQLRNQLYTQYNSSFLEANPMIFVRLLGCYGQPEHLHQYLDKHFSSMTLNETLYVLQRGHSLFPAAKLDQYLLRLFNDPPVKPSPKQSKWMVDLALNTNVPKPTIDAFVAKLEEK